MSGPEIERLIQLLARLPGLGPRSARRAVLHLLKRKESALLPLAEAMRQAAAAVRPCARCGNLDASDPCRICANPERDRSSICVVADVGDVWALERSGVHRGTYHVLGGVLSALDGVVPEDLNLAGLLARARGPGVEEIILALDATVDGITTAHYVQDLLAGTGVRVSRPAQGVPVGGELDYLDDGTLAAAFQARRPIG